MTRDHINVNNIDRVGGVAGLSDSEDSLKRLRGRIQNHSTGCSTCRRSLDIMECIVNHWQEIEKNNDLLEETAQVVEIIRQHIREEHQHHPSLFRHLWGGLLLLLVCFFL